MTPKTKLTCQASRLIGASPCYPAAFTNAFLIYQTTWHTHLDVPGSTASCSSHVEWNSLNIDYSTKDCDIAAIVLQCCRMQTSQFFVLSHCCCRMQTSQFFVLSAVVL